VRLGVSYSSVRSGRASLRCKCAERYTAHNNRSRQGLEHDTTNPISSKEANNCAHEQAKDEKNDKGSSPAITESHSDPDSSSWCISLLLVLCTPHCWYPGYTEM
jgi:hypothetical protein